MIMDIFMTMSDKSISPVYKGGAVMKSLAQYAYKWSKHNQGVFVIDNKALKKQISSAL